MPKLIYSAITSLDGYFSRRSWSVAASPHCRTTFGRHSGSSTSAASRAVSFTFTTV